MIWLVLMFVSGVAAIYGGILMGDWEYTAMAAGMLVVCCLIIAYGFGAFKSKSSKQQRRDAQQRFENASHAAYLSLVDKAGRRKITAAEREFMERNGFGG